METHLFILQNYIAWHCIHYMHAMTLHYITLHYITLHYITFQCATCIQYMTCADIRTCIRTCMEMCIHACFHTHCMRTCMHGHIHIYMHVCMRACLHQSFTHIHGMHTCMHACMHAHGITSHHISSHCAKRIPLLYVIYIHTSRHITLDHIALH